VISSQETRSTGRWGFWNSSSLRIFAHHFLPKLLADRIAAEFKVADLDFVDGFGIIHKAFTSHLKYLSLDENHVFFEIGQGEGFW
jgi:hypothetical protein